MNDTITQEVTEECLLYMDMYNCDDVDTLLAKFRKFVQSRTERDMQFELSRRSEASMTPAKYVSYNNVR